MLDSVLTASQITRISDSEFKCTLPTMNFFGTKIQPLLYVDVNVYPEFNRSEIVVRRAETVGSETAEKVNGTFSISAINIVSAGEIYVQTFKKVFLTFSRFQNPLLQSANFFILSSLSFSLFPSPYLCVCAIYSN